MSMEQEEFDLVALLNNYGTKSDQKEREFLDCNEMVQLVSMVSGYSVEDLKKRSRVANLVEWRQVTMFLIYNFTSLSFKQVGDILNRDHATAIYACNQVKKAIDGFNSELLLKYRIAEEVFKIQFNL